MATTAVSRKSRTTLGRRLAAEAIGTAYLLAAVVGSGIMAERLSGGNGGLALLANAIATGAALLALIVTLAPASGAHFNPVVTLAAAWNGGVAWRETPAYVVAQLAGAVMGVLAAHAMFALPLFAASQRVRAGGAQTFSEFVATFGLVLVVRGCERVQLPAAAAAVAAYITAAYWFTASTSFANPVVTVARSLTDTFSGIRPADVPAFVVAQLAGAAAAVLLSHWLLRGPSAMESPA